EVQTDIAARLRLIHVPAGVACCREGQSGDEMYLIESGRFGVDGTLGGKSVRFAQLGPGAVFGEIALLTGEPRSATVTAETEGWLWALGRGDFQALIERYPDLRVAVERLAAERRRSKVQPRLQNENTVLASLRELTTALVIGRAPNCDVVLDHPTVSRN